MKPGAGGDGSVAPVSVPFANQHLLGDLGVPAAPAGVVIFAHGSGSSRHSPRNQRVARRLEAAGFATLLIDLLTADEEAVDVRTAHLRFDIALLAGRLVTVIDWMRARESWPLGVFGASTGAAAALVAAAARPGIVTAVVSRGGRPDLAGTALSRVEAPTLLIVGGNDAVVVDLNRQAMAQMRAHVVLHVIPGATHLFEESGALEEVANQAAAWFAEHLTDQVVARGCPTAMN